MRWGYVGGSVLGAAAIYVCAAACSASSSGGGGALEDARAAVDALLDQIASPVADAKADTPPLQTATEACDKTYACNTVQCLYAEHAFPGRTAAELRTVIAQATFLPVVSAPAGYTVMNVPVFIKDGSVATYCGTTATPAYQSITFFFQP